MKEKITDWLYFHVEILERYRLPYFVWVVGIIFMLLAQYFYPKFINGIYNFQLFGQFPFKPLIENNINYLIHGLWLIPLIVFGFFVVAGVQIHQRNVKNVYRY